MKNCRNKELKKWRDEETTTWRHGEMKKCETLKLWQTCNTYNILSKSSLSNRPMVIMVITVHGSWLKGTQPGSPPSPRPPPAAAWGLGWAPLSHQPKYRFSPLHQLTPWGHDSIGTRVLFDMWLDLTAAWQVGVPEYAIFWWSQMTSGSVPDRPTKCKKLFETTRNLVKNERWLTLESPHCPGYAHRS